MHRPLWLQLLTALAVAVGVWSMWRIPSQKRTFEKLLQRAMDSFRKSVVQSEQERFSFNGTTAEVVLVEPIGMGEDSFALTVYARNHAGEYFMFKATAKKHWLKHVEPHVAKAVLKHRFIPPAEAIGA
jgi:hypothetical protein